MQAKRKRHYDSTLRRTRSAEIKLRILSVARKLFAQHGVDRVTIDQIAEEAAVSPATVYSSFKSKSGILKSIIHKTFFGNQYAALAERIKTTTDPIELLKITACISRVIFDNEKAEIGLVRVASVFSPELKRVEKEFEQLRFDLQKGRAELLVRIYPAAQELGISKVRDILWMLTGRDIYRMFVLERDWSSDAYQEWLATTLIQLLTGQSESIFSAGRR